MDKTTLINKEKTLLYITVYDKLFKMINEGSFPEGSRLPSEPKLATTLGVSRSTLRQALALLQDDGLIKNVHGKGNYIIKNTILKNKGLETSDNPIYKCCNEEIDDVEIEFHIEPPTDYMKQILKRDTAVAVIIDRWFKSKNTIVAYTFTVLPIETISEFHIDLNKPSELLELLENKIYKTLSNSLIEIKHSTAGNFSAKKYILSSKGHCHLLQESLYTNSKFPAAVNKHYLPLESSTIIINPIIKKS